VDLGGDGGAPDGRGPAGRGKPVMGLAALRNRITLLRETVATELWPLPTVGLVVSALLGFWLPVLDDRVDHNLPAGVTLYLFGGGPDAARSVLSAVAGSLITVTSLTFSLTVVTLQLASSQFSPRLLRTFSRDRFVHVTLALFLGTFTYSLVVLRTVRTANGDQQIAVVPQVSVTVALFLALASVLGLVLFLAHLARQIRVETILANVHEEATETLHRVLEVREDGRPSTEVPPAAPRTAVPIIATRSGFLVSVDEDALLAAAHDVGALLRVDCPPGGSLVAGTPLGTAWSADGAPLSEEVRDRLFPRVIDAIYAGPERTAAQDVGLGVRQLTDVANKALSPGINDPTTAVHALGHLSALMCESLGHQLGPKLLRDEAGLVRVVLNRLDFGELLDGAIAQPRRYGAAAPAVLVRIAALLREVAWMTRDDDDKDAVRDQVRRMRDTIDEQSLGTTEVHALHAALHRAETALEGTW
jgi:uncharacterized membrane protein